MGYFIVITGLDGSGTSSVGIKLAEIDKGSILLKTPPLLFQDAKEKIDEHVLNVSNAAHYLFYQASNMYVSEIIKDHKKESDSNIYCVRYVIDTIASHRANGLLVNYSHDVDGFKMEKPDYIFFLGVDEKVRQERMKSRKKSLLDFKSDQKEFRDRLLEEFKKMSQHFIEIDTTNKDLNQVVNEIVNHIKTR